MKVTMVLTEKEMEVIERSKENLKEYLEETLEVDGISEGIILDVEVIIDNG